MVHISKIIRNFAAENRENGLHLDKERALCTRFAPSQRASSLYSVCTVLAVEKVMMSENKRNLTEKEEYYKLITDEKSNHIRSVFVEE